jgi:hypothetical protein
LTDIETDIYSEVSGKLKTLFPGIFVSGEYVASPSSFPAASLEESINSTYQRTLDGSGENHSQVYYTANVYSNKSSGKKAECKAIMAAIDEEMIRLGFIRVGTSPAEVPNANQSIYRMVSRYRAVVSNDGKIYRI